MMSLSPTRRVAALAVALFCLVAVTSGHVLTPPSSPTAKGGDGGGHKVEVFAAFLELATELAISNKFIPTKESVAELHRAVEDTKAVHHLCPSGDTPVPEAWKTFNTHFLNFLDSVVKHGPWEKGNVQQKLLGEAVEEAKKIISDGKVEASECKALEKLASDATKASSPTARRLLSAEKPKKPLDAIFAEQAEALGELTSYCIERWLMELITQYGDAERHVQHIVESGGFHNVWAGLTRLGSVEIALDAKRAVMQLRTDLRAAKSSADEKFALEKFEKAIGGVERALHQRAAALERFYSSAREDHLDLGSATVHAVEDLSPSLKAASRKASAAVQLSGSGSAFDDYLSSSDGHFSGSASSVENVVGDFDTHFTFMAASVVYRTSAGKLEVKRFTCASDNSKGAHSEQVAASLVNDKIKELVKAGAKILQVRVKLDQMWVPCGSGVGADHNCEGFLHAYVHFWESLGAKVLMTLHYQGTGEDVVDPTHDKYVPPKGDVSK